MGNTDGWMDRKSDIEVDAPPKNLGTAYYTQEIIKETRIGHSLKKMWVDDRKAIEYKFKSAYYLALKERRFSNCLLYSVNSPYNL